MSNQEAQAQSQQHHKVSNKMRDFYRHGGFSQVHSHKQSNTTPEEYDDEYWEKLYPHHPYYMQTKRRSVQRDVPSEETYNEEYYRHMYPTNADKAV